jgi:hypothetical protein
MKKWIFFLIVHKRILLKLITCLNLNLLSKIIKIIITFILISSFIVILNKVKIHPIKNKIIINNNLNLPLLKF